MKKINELTKEQSELVSVYRDKWLNIGRSTQTPSREKTIESINTIYEICGKEKPKHVFFFPSPIQCQLAVNILKSKEFSDLNLDLEANFWANLWDNLRANLWDNLWANLGANLGDNLWDNLGANLWDNLRDNLWANLGANLWDNLRANLGDNLWDNLGDNLRANLWDNLGANLWANLWDNLKLNYNNVFYGHDFYYWVGTYDFILNELFSSEISKYKDYIKFLEALKHIHLFIPFNDVVFVSDFHTELHLNNDGRLHKDFGPAMMYSDGYSLFYLNGVRMKKEFITKQPEEFTKEDIANEKNADVRREIIRKITPNRAMNLLGAKVIHAKDYTGLEDFQTHEGRNYELLECDWGTGSKRIYLKMIYPNFGHTIIEAVHPECRTVDQALGFRDPIINRNESWKNKNYIYMAPVYLT